MYLIISDTHIGDRHSNKFLPGLFSVLKKYSQYDNCHLVLNGDIIDWAKHLGFDERHRVFFTLIGKFKKITYIEGNHDWFVAGLKDVIPCISFKEELLLHLDNKIVRIIHGHQTDFWATKLPRFNRFLIKFNHWGYNLINVDVQHKVRKTWLVQKFLLERQEKKLIRKENIANVLIAGHTHRPCVRECDGIVYYNTGDWVEADHRAFVIIDDQNNIELIKYEG